ncbi:MAG: 23S rRNA (guanosine(2251)-2'-O)-methyltransferase RlmB [Oscillospiraceae bacterium]
MPNRPTNKGENKNANRNAKRTQRRHELVSDRPNNEDESSNNDKIYGRNPIIEALEHGREIDKILVQDEIRHTQLGKILNLAKSRNIQYQVVDKRRLDAIVQGENHQGVVAYVAAQKYVEVDDILNYAIAKGEKPFIVIAEGITDPHNLGSIIRTANAAGAHGVIIPKNRSVSLNSTVSKVSAGAIEYTRVAKVPNITQTIKRLQKEGLWIVGTDLSGTQMHYECDLKGPLGIVIGSEGEGISRLVRETCDFVVKIPMLGETQSLNASVAAGVLLYEAVRQRLS